MNQAGMTLELVQQALAELDAADGKLSSVIRKAIRIARLRGDYESLYWLAMEMRTIGDQNARYTIYYEVAPHLTRAGFEALHERSLDAYVARRFSHKIETSEGEGQAVLGLSVPELEARIERMKEMAQELAPRSGISASDRSYTGGDSGPLRARMQIALIEWNSIQHRITQAIYDYLSLTEQQLYHGQANADIFEENRRFVDDKLCELAPGALEQFRAAVERLTAGGPEAGSHAATSCRRVLKTIADHLYPARTEPVAGADGRPRVLTEDKWVSRLWQYAFEKIPGSTSQKIALAQIENLGERINRLNDLASKGVHADVSPFEAHQCTLQTYVLIGDLLRLAEGSSALEQSAAEIDRLYPDPAPNPPADRADGQARRSSL
jgi:hypothetical protein